MTGREPQEGDYVQTWFDTGGKNGMTIVYGKVIYAGPNTFMVRWESGATNRVRRAEPGDVKYCEDVDAAAMRRISDGDPPPPRARRLKAIAAWINENLPELEARTERGHCNTDRKLAGTRFIHRGKGRWGTHLKVYWKVDRIRPFYDHNSAETYRSNDEVERWLAGYIANCHKGKHSYDLSQCRYCRRAQERPLPRPSNFGRGPTRY